VPGAALASPRDTLSTVIYLQPLLATGQPWADQVRLLATFDLLARHQAMQGEAIYRQAGWAAHGLPIEIAVERSLDTETGSYDLARFNAACRAAASEGMRQGEALAEWLGVWLEPDRFCATQTPQAIGLVWQEFRRLWTAGRVVHQQRVAPICPRCATCLSDAEAARRASERNAASVWVRLPWDTEPGAYLLTWTPIPWALVGMVALAAHPEASYALVELEGDDDHPPLRVVLSEAALSRTLAGPHRVVRRMKGRALRGSRYHPPFTFTPLPAGADRVILSEAVPVERGTGLLPVTPSFDSLSLWLAQAHDLPVPGLVDDAGKFNDTVTPWRGFSPMESEPLLVDDLQARGLLFRQEIRTQAQALCPYCETPLLYQAWPLWLLETGSGPWIISRNRAWGAPLPVWTCDECGQEICIAGLDDLARRTGLNVNQIEPHRPEVDALTFPCSRCRGTMHRVAEVMDAAFEAAVLPWVTVPEDEQPAAAPRRTLAVGLGDKHLGWLGDMTEVAALLRGSLAWEQALALPEGSGAPLDPDHSTPADALRWAVYSGTTPASAEHDFLRPLRQLAALALEPQLAPEEERAPGPQRRNGEKEGRRVALLDRWLAARLQQAIGLMTEALADCDTCGAAWHLAKLVHDLVDWYAPRRPAGVSPALGALAPLLAPFTPHLAEAIYCQTSRREADSVHLVDWPTADPDAIDEHLLGGIALIRRLADLGQAARVRAAVPVDQAVRRAWVGFVPPEAAEPLIDEAWLAEALGAARVKVTPDALTKVTWHLALDPQQAIGRDISPSEIDAALIRLAPEATVALLSQVWSGRSVGLEVSGRAVTLLPDEVAADVQALPGCAAAVEPGHLVVLELEGS